jgi:hypothetical protein
MHTGLGFLLLEMQAQPNVTVGGLGDANQQQTPLVAISLSPQRHSHNSLLANHKSSS